MHESWSRKADDDVRWMIRLVATPASPVPGCLRRTLHPGDTRQLGVRISVGAEGMAARFHVSAPDAERASMRALARWRRLGSVLDVPDWPVCSLVVERHDPDLRPWRTATSPADETRPVVELRGTASAPNHARATVLGQPLLPRPRPPQLFDAPDLASDG